MKRLKLMSIRIERGYKAKEMAKEIGVSVNNYYKYENGDIDIPLSKAQKISEVLNYPMDKIFPTKTSE